MSKLESALADQLRNSGIAIKFSVYTQYKFLEDRRFKADFAIPARRLLIECQGGVYTKGRHVRGAGYAADCARLNLAQVHGWKMLYITPQMIKSGEAIRTIEEICQHAN